LKIEEADPQPRKGEEQKGKSKSFQAITTPYTEKPSLNILILMFQTGKGAL